MVMVLPPLAALIVAVPAFVVSLSATKADTLFAVAVAPELTTRSSPVARSAIVSLPESTLKVSLPASPVKVSLSAPPVILSFPVPPLRTSLPPAPVIISFPVPPVIISTPAPPARL